MAANLNGGSTMKTIRIILAGLLVASSGGCGSSSTTIPGGGGGDTNQPGGETISNPEEKIVGKWELTTAGGQPGGSTWEFTKDGAILIPRDVGGTQVTIQGSYKIAGPNVIITMQKPGGMAETETHSIKVLNNEKMVLAQGSKETHFKRK
jgi:uncharacterized protein (TIGR03066 family)